MPNQDKFINRRKGHDGWFISLRVFAVLGWLLFVVALLVAFFAGPERAFGLVKFHHLELRQSWLYPLTDYLFYLLCCNAALSIFAIGVNHYRSRRAGDLPGFNSMLLLLVTISWIIYLMFAIN